MSGGALARRAPGPLSRALVLSALARVAWSSGLSSLDEFAERTVRAQWRFLPVTREGQAVDGRVAVPIRFRLAEARRDQRVALESAPE